MNKEDLIKKLENIEVPDIELQSHQRWLRLALLNSGYFTPFRNKFLTGFKEKTMNPILFWTKRLVPAGCVLALILVMGFSVINPKLQIARAMEIAKNDPQIQQLIKDYGVEIKEVKLQDGKAYVLLALPEEKLPPLPALKGGEETATRGSGQFYIAYQDPKTGEVIKSSGSIAEIDLKGKKVEKLEMAEETKIDIVPLTEEEKTRAIEIVNSDPNNSDPKMKEMFPQDAKKVVAVKPLPPLKLKIQTTSEENGVKVVAYDEREDRRVDVIFESERGKDIITVNLTTGAIERAMLMGAIGEIQEQSGSEYPYPIKPKFYLEPVGCDVSITCVEGYIPHDTGEKDAQGCPIKKCIKAELGCDVSITCVEGYIPHDTGEKDAQGCPIKKCIKAELGCDVSITCVEGYIPHDTGEKDAQGCPIKKCIKAELEYGR